MWAELDWQNWHHKSTAQACHTKNSSQPQNWRHGLFIPLQPLTEWCFEWVWALPVGNVKQLCDNLVGQSKKAMVLSAGKHCLSWLIMILPEEKKEKPDTKGIQIQQEFTFLFSSVLYRIYLLGQPILHGGRWEVWKNLIQLYPIAQFLLQKKSLGIVPDLCFH